MAEQSGYRLEISDNLMLTCTRPPVPSIAIEELPHRQKAEVIGRLKYERDAVCRWSRTDERIRTFAPRDN